MKTKNLLSELEKKLEQYNIILVAVNGQKDIHSFWEQFYKLSGFKPGKKKVLCIVTEEAETKTGDFSVYYASKSAMQKLKELYYTYEFSDKIRIVSKENNFGNIFNLVETGILTKEEAVMALL